MNTLTIQSPSTSPPILPERARDGLASILRHMERVGLGYEIPASMALLDGQRAYLSRHADLQDRALGAAGVEYARVEIAAMFDVMKIRSADEKTLEERIEIYAGDLASLPAFALSKACADYRQGVVGDGDWAPTPGEIRKRGIAIMEPLAKERASIRALLAAKPAPERENNELRRQAAADLIRNAWKIKIPDRAAALRKFGDPPPPKTPEQITAQEAAEKRLAELATMPTPRLSPTLRASLGLPETQQREDAA